MENHIKFLIRIIFTSYATEYHRTQTRDNWGLWHFFCCFVIVPLTLKTLEAEKNKIFDCKSLFIFFLFFSYQHIVQVCAFLKDKVKLKAFSSPK